ncbi:PASTA domain-containing protein [Pontibacter sp. G13]|uniref:PASTA domain-containing protein n=1 Tax=Pontibacter sp. G13 TaxID=3074898 RepID=UPI00288B1134|nr:PASTA domain-containing protein [Pontibacter sp. G13]WNJ20533.1 PASTA domain-containing protein [Pontibacter sp. G13]
MKYFISKEFFLTLAGLGLLGVLVYLMVFFWVLPGYTRHGEGILVPDISELAFDDAVKTLEEADLKLGLVDSVYFENLDPGVVFRQYPAAYTRVKPERTISLTINRYQPPMVAMPDIIDKKLHNAKALLESKRLGIGRVTRKADKSINTILDYSFKGKRIEPGTMIKQGSKIDVTISNGYSSHRVPVPDLSGYKYEDALRILNDLGLISVPSYQAEGPEEYMGRVFDQRPKARFGDSLFVGQSVDIFVYGEEPEENEAILVEEVSDEEGGF